MRSGELRYFAYGTLQRGFPNWEDLSGRLGEPVGRFLTVEPHGLVVPTEAGCGNPGCGLLHRMAALLPGIDGIQVEGDLFAIDTATLAAIDRLENYDERREAPGLYVRTEIRVAPLAGGPAQQAIAHRVRDPAPWQALVRSGRAELMSRYERRLAGASPKQCCIRNPGHTGPHDVTDPFASQPRPLAHSP
jgi:gamma-glutamylcyclotransferase (GGCT)/AIG2-like uncharacterized protein YtfP